MKFEGVDNKYEWQFGLLVVIAGLLAALGAWNSCRVDIMQFDPMDYMMNSRLIWTRSGECLNFNYSSERVPLLALALAPMEAFKDSVVFHWRVVHLCVFSLSVLALYAVWRLLMMGFTRTLALMVVLLFAVSPLFLNYHFSPFMDVISMFTMTSVLIVWMQTNGDSPIWRHGVLGATMGVAMLSKYPLLVVPFFYVFFELVLAVTCEKQGTPLESLLSRCRQFCSKRSVALIVACGTVLHVGHVLALCLAWPGNSFLYNNVHPYIMIVSMFVRNADAGDQIQTGSVDLGIDLPTNLSPIHEYFAQLPALLSWPVCLAMALGLAKASRRRNRLDVLIAGPGILFIAIMTLVISHKEARYMFPAMPSLLYLATTGAVWMAERFAQFAQSWSTMRRRSIAAMAGLVISIWPARNTLTMVSQLSDPILATPTLVPFAAAMKDRLREDEVILWESSSKRARESGRPHSDVIRPSYLHIIYPEARLNVPYDEYWGVYALSARDLEYLLDHPVDLLVRTAQRDDADADAHENGNGARIASVVSVEIGEDEPMARDEFLIRALKQDGIVLTPGVSHHWKHGLSPEYDRPRPKLGVSLVNRVTLAAEPKRSDGGSLSFVSSDRAIVLELPLAAPEIRAFTNGRDEAWRIWATDRDGKLHRLGETGHLDFEPVELELIKIDLLELDFTKPLEPNAFRKLDRYFNGT